MLFRTKSWYKWIVLAIVFLLMLSFAISLQSLPPLFDKIAEDVSFTNSQAGMLMGAYAIPGIFLPFLVAYLANKYNQKSIILISLVTIIIGLVGFAISGSFYALLFYRLIAGIGATALVVLSPLLITMFFDQENIGAAMGIFNAAVPSGTVIAANLFGILGEKVQWRFLILGIAIFTAVVLGISFFILYIPKKNDEEDSSVDTRESLRGLLSNFKLWLVALIWALCNAQLLSYVTFGPQYFQKIGMNVQKAGFLSSFIMLVPIFLSPIVGIIIDKFGWKKRLLLIGSIISVFTFIIIGRTSFGIPLWAVALGIGFAPVPVFVFSTLPEIVETNQMGMGLGILTAASNLGIAIGPMVFGSLLDNTNGNFSLGFIMLGIVSVIIIAALGGVKKA